MILQSLNLTYYRNIVKAEIELDAELNVISGENGQGKTNLLEAIWLLTGGKSFRGGKDKELIKKGEDFAIVEGILNQDEHETSLRIAIAEHAKGKVSRKAKKNGADIGRATLLAGTFPAVVFAPNHLQLVKGSPEGRRKFLDATLCQLYPNYLLIYRRYQRALLQKNALLKKIAFNTAFKDQNMSILEVYNNELVSSGEEIQKRRLEYLEKLIPHAVLRYDEISSGAETLALKYIKSFETGLFAEKLKSVQEREITQGCCLVGVHREDFDIFLNGESAKIYASQGQQRSAVLSLKLAEADVMYEVTEKKPAILLDDVLSELDAKRQTYLLQKVKGRQTFVTTCDESAFEKTKGKIINVNSGIITE